MNEPSHRSRGVLWLLALIALLLAATGIYQRSRAHAALAQSTLAQAEPVVDAVHPHAGDGLAAEVRLPADVQPYIDAPIYARASGYVRHWYADIGQHVKAGQLLADIDTPEIEAQRRQAIADLASAKANNDIAQTTAHRYQDLKRSGLVSQQDVDTAQSTADARAAGLESARQNLQHLSQLQDFSRVLAPFDGLITARRVDVGALVNAGSQSGQELFHLASTQRLRVYVQVPQDDAERIRVGDTARLVPNGTGTASYPVSVVRTAGAIDPSTRTLRVEFQADNALGQILPGSFAEVRLKLPGMAQRFSLPSNTLLFRGDGLHVARVDGSGHARLVEVEIGRDDGNRVEVLGGLAADDRVIVNPPDSLIDGEAVRVRAVN